MSATIFDDLQLPRSIRQRCQLIFDAVERGDSPHFSLHLEALPATARLVIEVMRANYPSLAIPYHSRWRHFEVAGTHAYERFVQALPQRPLERGRSQFDLALVSVLLDAGAGPAWSYRDGQTGTVFKSSEGLAVASLDLLNSGFFSADPAAPLRFDAIRLPTISPAAFERAMQHSSSQPLQAIEGRWQLLTALARTVSEQPAIFARDGSGRLGCFFDHLVQKAQNGRLSALTVLAEVLAVFGSIWPGRLSRGGRNLGDCWEHPAVQIADATQGLVPFHKLSQWLSYSLLEPLEAYGIKLVDIEQLTGLPEYRNGGLFIDTDVIRVRSPELLKQALSPRDEALVEWRALTVILLDRLAAMIQQQLGLDATALPLAKVLQGGTWAAGRRLAQEKRAGAPPLQIQLEGTVF